MTEQELCPKCGWALSGHLRSQYGPDCPPGGSRPGFSRSEVPEPSAEDYESGKLRALGGGESEALCPDCRGELTSWFCDRCSNTGLIKREPQGEPSDARVQAAMDAAVAYYATTEVGEIKPDPVDFEAMRAALRAAGDVK